MKGTNQHFRAVHRLAGVSILAVLVMIGGCKSDYTGKMVPAKNRIKLEENGPHHGSWTGTNAVFDYTYTRTPDQLEITGNVKVIGIQSQLTNFSFWMNLLEGDGKIVESTSLFTSNGRTSGPVEHRLKLPPGTDAVAFSYQGQASSFESSNDFFSSPFE